MTQKSSLGYFSREDLADLFHLGDPRVAQTQKDLHALHAHERVTDEYTDRHIQYLHEIGGVHGISDHDLLFSKTQAVESSAVAKQQAKEYALSHTSAYTLVSSENNETHVVLVFPQGCAAPQESKLGRRGRRRRRSLPREGRRRRWRG